MLPVTFVLCTLVLGAHLMLVLGFDCEYKGQKFMAGENLHLQDECALFTCHSPVLSSTLSCPSVVRALPCRKLKGDVSKPFPECCPRLDCS
ncbi:venom peptide HsVx1 [Drosophila innubila]|uniref:venom peptide HsVx1 n=1 Tax=Drosophila innubila TaxID=198719 RepID=UPI00148E55E6|nr:venom peptide HsVx1 [Drosophila innubila]